MLSVVMWIVFVPAQTGTAKQYLIQPNRLPKPGATPSVDAQPFVSEPDRLTKLRLPSGFRSNLFATGLRSPRSLAVAPNGDVFCVESYQGRITLLRDKDGTGRADERHVFATGLNLPYGIAFHGNYLYVANTDSVVRFSYRAGQTEAAGEPETVVEELPHGGRKNHWTRNLAFSPDGKTMFVTVGSKTNDEEEPPPRATILACDPEGKERRIFARGMRNPVGIAFRYGTSEMWTTCVERDFLGDDLVPDFVTRVEEGDDFGWPQFYIGANRAPGFETAPARKVRVPDVLIQAHSVPLGLVFGTQTRFPLAYRDDLFVAMRGSTNRKIRSGYMVARIRFVNGRPTPGYEEFASGWVPDRRKEFVFGRPVGLAVSRDGCLLISDEAGHRIWRVAYKGTPSRK
ncbi:MAG: PQQ-dependent sugar dehydrogenase [Fimbriimonas sp.]